MIIKKIADERIPKIIFTKKNANTGKKKFAINEQNKKEAKIEKREKANRKKNHAESTIKYRIKMELNISMELHTV